MGRPGVVVSADQPITPEQEARDILDRMGVDGAQSMTTGDVVELANLIAEVRALRADRDRWQDAYVQARLNQETT
jgi:hypothetical protein